MVIRTVSGDFYRSEDVMNFLLDILAAAVDAFLTLVVIAAAAGALWFGFPILCYLAKGCNIWQ